MTGNPSIKKSQPFSRYIHPQSTARQVISVCPRGCGTACVHEHGRVVVHPSTLEQEYVMRYAKFVVAVITAALVAAQTAVPMSEAVHGWVTVALSALGAIAVFAVPNVEPPVPAPTKE